MTVGQLKQRYIDVFGEETRLNIRQFLILRVAWRSQSLAEGGLSERARRRAIEIANDTDIRVRARNRKLVDSDAFLKVTARLSAPGRRRPSRGARCVLSARRPRPIQQAMLIKIALRNLRA